MATTVLHNDPGLLYVLLTWGGTTYPSRAWESGRGGFEFRPGHVLDIEVQTNCSEPQVCSPVNCECH